MAYREFLALTSSCYLYRAGQIPPVVEALQSFVGTGRVRALRQC